MGLNAFILLPENDDSLLNIGDTTSGFQSFIKECNDLLNQIRDDDDNQLFYDEENIKVFIEKYKELPEDENLPKIEGLIKRLRAVIRKSSINIQDDQQALGEVIYVLWNLNEFTPNYAPAILAEIAERIFQNPEEKQLLLNINNALKADRKVFLVFMLNSIKLLRQSA